MSSSGTLTNEDHHDFDKWIASLLARHKTGEKTTEDAVSDLMQVIAAVDLDEIGEVRAWISGKNDKKT